MYGVYQLKTIIFVEDEGLVAELGWKRPFPLISVGGNRIIGHTLDLFEAYVGDELIIVTPDIEVAAWLFEQYPDLSASCVKSWDDVGALDGELLVINGRFLTNPNLPADLPAVAAITAENGVAMAFWTKNGSTLHNAPSPHFENWLNEADATHFPAHFSFRPLHRRTAIRQHALARFGLWQRRPC